MGPPLAREVTILIIEDDLDVAGIIRDELEEHGFTIMGMVGSAEAAVALAAKNPPMVAIVDIRLAGKRDGVHAAGELRKRYGTEILFVSGAVDPVSRARAQAIGPVAFLWKPFVASQLLSAVARVTKRSD